MVPNVPNGIITQYEVQYRTSIDASWNAYNISSRTIGNRLFGNTERLLPGIEYLLQARAYTRAGAGPLGNTLIMSVVSKCKLLDLVSVRVFQNLCNNICHYVCC